MASSQTWAFVAVVVAAGFVLGPVVTEADRATAAPTDDDDAVSTTGCTVGEVVTGLLTLVAVAIAAGTEAVEAIGVAAGLTDVAVLLVVEDALALAAGDVATGLIAADVGATAGSCDQL